MFDNYIFDFDGTIINSQEEVLICFKKAFELAKYEIDEKRLNSNVIGPPLREIIKLIAPDLKDENKISEIHSYFVQIYDNDEKDCTILYDGVYDFLKKIKQDGKKIFMATFKLAAPTKRLVKSFKLDTFFDDIYCLDSFSKEMTKDEMIKDILLKYSLDKSKTVMIGDAPTDSIAARKAGISSIGVLWGYGSDKTDLIKNSDYIISNISEIENLKVRV